MYINFKRTDKKVWIYDLSSIPCQMQPAHSASVILLIFSWILAWSHKMK